MSEYVEYTSTTLMALADEIARRRICGPMHHPEPTRHEVVLRAHAEAWKKLEGEHEEQETAFRLYDSAIRRGTEKWLEAHPPKEGAARVWPDAGELVGWLLESGLIALADDAEMANRPDDCPSPPGPGR